MVVMRKIIVLLCIVLPVAQGCSPPPPPQEPTPVVPVMKNSSFNNGNLNTEVLVAASTMNTVAMIDVETLDVSAVTVGADPVSIDVAPDGRKAYVANMLSNNVSVLSLPSMTVYTINDAGIGPTSVAVTPDGRYAVDMNSDPGLSFIRTSTNTVTPVSTISKPSGFAVSFNSGSVFAAERWTSSIERIFVPSFTRTTMAIPCNDSSGIALSDDNAVIAVGCTSPYGIVLDDLTHNVVNFIDTSFSPSAVRFFHNSHYLAAMNVRPGLMFILDADDASQRWYLNAGYDSLAFAINGSNTALAVANNSSDDMTFFSISGLSSAGFSGTSVPLVAGPIGVAFVDNDKYVVVTEGTPMGGASIVNTSDLSVRSVFYIGARGILNR